MVTFTESNNGSNPVVTRGSSVIEWLGTDVMSHGVNAKGSLLNDKDTDKTGIDQTTHIVVEKVTTDKSWNDESG